MMTRLLPFCVFAALGVVVLPPQSGIGPIGQLQGKVDSNNALIVAPTASIGTTPSQTNTIANLQGKVDANSALVVTMLGNGSTATPNVVCLDGTNQDACLARQSANNVGIYTSSAANTFAGLIASNVFANSQRLTSSGAAGVSVTTNGVESTVTTAITITGASAFVCNAVTCDITITTTQAQQWVSLVTARITTTFACSATCTTSTLSLQLGTTAGGTELLASIDADAATGVFGDADAEMGTLNARAAAVQGGTYLNSATAINLRLTSGTGNIGNGSTSNLSQGAIVITFTTNKVI